VDFKGTISLKGDAIYDCGRAVLWTGNVVDEELRIDNAVNQRPDDDKRSSNLQRGRTHKVSIEYGVASTAEVLHGATVSSGTRGFHASMDKQMDSETAIWDAIKVVAGVDQVTFLIETVIERARASIESIWIYNSVTTY